MRGIWWGTRFVRSLKVAAIAFAAIAAMVFRLFGYTLWAFAVYLPMTRRAVGKPPLEVAVGE